MSIKVFAALFGCATLWSLMIAVSLAGSARFGFAMTPEAAATLAQRILAIRLLGIAFAATLLAFVVLGRSRAARGALGARWVLGLLTSVAFLRGTGIVSPAEGVGTAVVALSVLQLAAEGLAIAILYGSDASDWLDSVSHPYPR